MQEKDVYAELSSIRNLMERSSKFISLSGLAGILAGVYALAGARMAFRILTNHQEIGAPADNLQVIRPAMILIGLAVFVLSAITAYILTVRKARKKNENVWNPVSRRMLAAIAFPMITGGLVMGILIIKDAYTFIPSACLIFYGLALVAGSQYTYSDVKWLGIGQILLGLLALYLPGYGGLLMWTIGFGALHILYGTIMYFKYDR